MPAFLREAGGWFWRHRMQVLAMVLIVSLVMVHPAKAQFFDPLTGIIIGALNAINQAITNVIGGALRIMNQTLGAIQGLVGAIQNLFQNVVYPQAAINRALALVGQMMGISNQMSAIAHVGVNSATLPHPQQLETTLLSRDPLSIPNVSANYQTVYQPLPPATDASPELRDVIDSSDAAAQAAMKRAIAIDAIADQELQAAQQLLSELQIAAPGTAPMIEAEASAWLVRAHAYTQSALADSMRLRAIDLANTGAGMKFNATYGVTTRRELGTMMDRQ